MQFSNFRDPKPTDRVIYIDGSFDMFNTSHCEAFRLAKARGDFLYVGIHDDDLVNRYSGQNYPILTLNERTLMVLQVKYVDDVILGAPRVMTQDQIKTLNISEVVASNKQLAEIERM